MWYVLIKEKDMYMWEAVFASRSPLLCQIVGIFYSFKYMVDIRYQPQSAYR